MPIGLEAAPCVQPDRGFVAADDAGEDGVETMVGGEAEQRLEQESPDAFALVGAVDVDGVLDRGPVRRARLVLRLSDPNPTTASPSTATSAGWAPGMLVEPLLLVLERARHEVECDRRLEHFRVVNRPNRLGVVERRQPDLHFPSL